MLNRALTFRCDPSLRRQAALHCAPQAAITDTMVVTPLFLRDHAPSQGHEHVAARVAALLDLRRPATIAGGVVSVVVNAIKRVVCARPGAHISNEALNPGSRAVAVQPPVTHFDAAPSISRIMFMLWIAASCFSILERGVLSAVTQAMNGRSLRHLFPEETSTRFRFPPSQGCARRTCFSAAIASALPDNSVVAPLHNAQRGQSAKFFSGQVFGQKVHAFVPFGDSRYLTIAHEEACAG